MSQIEQDKTIKLDRLTTRGDGRSGEHAQKAQSITEFLNRDSAKSSFTEATPCKRRPQAAREL